MQQQEDVWTKGLWVFGYGSLCWHPGFEYDRSVTGFVCGFSRKFWQGNTTHRGTEDKPGRVATLVADKESVVWGRAFEVRGEAALPYLENRECKLGGYLTQFATFFPRHKTEDDCLPPFPVLLYIATPNNTHWLGEAPVADIAQQILDCKGNSGHNVEYLLRLAWFIREAIPEAVDEHLFTLEDLVTAHIQERNLCLKTLMGDKVVPLTDAGNEEEAAGGAADAAAAAVPAVNTFEFTARVPVKKLRCLNI